MKEQDIRPAKVFQEYLRLSALDVEAYFSDEGREMVCCPGCCSTAGTYSFTKNGFDYVECVECASLFQSPRPSLGMLERFYQDSPSSNYWANEFFPAVAEKRREAIFVPRVSYIRQLCSDRNAPIDTIIDVGAGYGILLEEWAKRFPGSRCMAVEPGRNLAAECRKKGIEVLETVVEHAEAWAGLGDVVTCFEVLEHVHDPSHFVRCLWNLAKPGGYVILGCLGVEGFDIQVLWEKSKSISPPHHLNFLSIKGFDALFRRVGFQDVAVTTPGKLDVDIVRNSFVSDEGADSLQRFARTLLKRSEGTLDAFQKFLADHQLSSHVWVMARKAGA